MTTQELKSYIDRILGNSLRVLLPSYWWKRLFGAVVDKVEKAENSITSLTRKINETNNRIDDVESAKQGSSVVVVEWDGTESSTTANNKEAYALIKSSLENDIPIVVVIWNTMLGLADPHYVTKSFNIRNELDGTVAVWIRFVSEGTEDHSKYLMFKLTEDGTLKLNKVENIYDDFMSDISTNAVQNKVVTEALNSKADKTYVDNAIASAITNTLNTEV